MGIQCFDRCSSFSGWNFEAERSDFFHEFGHFPPSKMGRVRTKTVKKASKVLIEKYYTKLTLDFDTNKKIIEEIALIPSKPLRNKIAGFVTHLMKRLEKSTVRGISIKLQEEEREKRDNYVPDISELEKPLEIDNETKDLLKLLDMANLGASGVTAGGKF